MNSAHWLTYFRNNQLNRPDPQWHQPYRGDAATSAALARSLSHFQLGESGEGRCLLAQAGRVYRDDPAYCEALALFIGEEQEHARLLARLVERLGGRLIRQHWTQALFRTLRRSLGVQFEIEVLVIAELVGTAYYRLLRARAGDAVIQEVCDLVLRDEAQHVAFHAERFADTQSVWLPFERELWTVQFQILFLAAARIAWIDHRPALRAIDGTREEFFRAAREECIHFLAAVRPVAAESHAEATNPNQTGIPIQSVEQRRGALARSLTEYPSGV